MLDERLLSMHDKAHHLMSSLSCLIARIAYLGKGYRREIDRCFLSDHPARLALATPR